MKIYLTFILLILGTVGVNTLAQKFLKQRWNLWLGYGVPALIMMLFLGMSSTPPRHDWFGDFKGAYYPAGRLIIQNPSALYNIGLYGFVNIPILALFFAPFSALNKISATLLFTSLGGLAVLTTCYFLVKSKNIFGWRRIALLGIFVINGPLYHSLWYGNLTHFLLLLLLAILVCIEKKRDFLLGTLLAIAALIKLPLFLLGVYFALRKRWRILVGIGTALLGIVAASVLLFGFDLHSVWLDHIGFLSGKPISAYNVQSVDGFLARLLFDTNGNLRNWLPIEVDWRFKVIRYLLLLLLVGTTFWVCWRSKPPSTLEEENLEFSIVLCLALIISPISWTHYYLFLLVPFSFYLANRLAVPQGRLWSSLVPIAILLTSLPVITAEPANPVLRFLYSRLLISHYFLGGVLLLGVFLAARWQASKCSGLSQTKGGSKVIAINS